MCDDEATLQAEFEAEFEALTARTHHLYLRLTPLEAWALLGQIQLAMRHPKNVGPTRRMVESIARRIQFVVAPEGALAIIARRGWDRRYDEE